MKLFFGAAFTKSDSQSGSLTSVPIPLSWQMVCHAPPPSAGFATKGSMVSNNHATTSQTHYFIRPLHGRSGERFKMALQGYSRRRNRSWTVTFLSNPMPSTAEHRGRTLHRSPPEHGIFFRPDWLAFFEPSIRWNQNRGTDTKAYSELTSFCSLI